MVITEAKTSQEHGTSSYTERGGGLPFSFTSKVLLIDGGKKNQKLRLKVILGKLLLQHN
jgi:hypothetical protein